MRRRKKKPAQVISIILSIVMFGMMGFSQLVGSLGNNDGSSPANPTPFPTIATSRFEDVLIIGRSASYRLQAGEILALHYQGKIEEVITLHVTSEHNIAPQITIGAMVDDQPQPIIAMVPPKDNVTEICGLAFTYTGDYTFTFSAPLSSTYSVRFESGNTCDGE